ncbi:MAG: RagB/SusD family nutrient uptake outer membrane protein [Ignavibacteriales bacterium]|nr:RagB/SusD family nutrient uptake outer membrane protein [Ignavibacteriales bacterium]
MKANIFVLTICCLLIGLVAGCSLDQLNPNAPTEAQVLSTPEGVKALAVGVQAQYGETVNETVEASNFLAKQYFTMPASVLGLRELETGGNDVQGSNGTVATMWSQHYRVVKSAEDLITYASIVPLADGTRSGILALARTMKAMALGELIELYEKVPVDVTTSTLPAFSDRTTTLTTVISLLESARDQLTATPASADFNTNILGTGFDLTNAINAMIARYSLIQGNYAKALSAANAVDLSKTSSMFYNSTTSRNPIYLNAILVLYYKPVRTFRLNAEAGDGRVAFWVKAGTQNSFLGVPVDDFNQYITDNAKYYVYVPGEITLIKAEAYARQSDLANALIEVNKVRTKATDPAGIAANLPAKTAAQLNTQQAMLDEIYNQRLYELFISGTRLGDTRRFGKPGAETGAATRSRTRNWLPYPDGERLSNPNTPADPAN